MSCRAPRILALLSTAINTSLFDDKALWRMDDCASASPFGGWGSVDEDLSSWIDKLFPKLLLLYLGNLFLILIVPLFGIELSQCRTRRDKLHNEVCKNLGLDCRSGLILDIILPQLDSLSWDSPREICLSEKGLERMFCNNYYSLCFEVVREFSRSTDKC